MSAFEQSVLAALGRIEKKLGSAGATAEATGDSRAPLAVDFEASIINGPAAALFAAADSVPGDDGKKLVRVVTNRLCATRRWNARPHRPVPLCNRLRRCARSLRLRCAS